MIKNTRNKPIIFAKDFIETSEGLVFAVVSSSLEQDQVLCFLRYIKIDSVWNKLTTEPANAYLKLHHPNYLHYSPVLDAQLHAVPLTSIVKHHQPKQRLQNLIQSKQYDAIENDLIQLCEFLRQGGLDLAQTGITGSLLIGVQQTSSDIDLVCYSRATFHQCRAIVRDLIAEQHLHELEDQDWQASYQRRSCDLSYSDYTWHERRKYNKAIINGRKFDLNFIDDTLNPDLTSYQKGEAITLECIITDDTQGFDYPAEFKIAHDHIDAIVCFTATYTGQAFKGETVQVSGIVEQNQHGINRIVVGSSREAQGEYIKVIRV